MHPGTGAGLLLKAVVDGGMALLPLEGVMPGSELLVAAAFAPLAGLVSWDAMLPGAGALFAAVLLLVLLLVVNASVGMLHGRCLECCGVLKLWSLGEPVDRLPKPAELTLVNGADSVSAVDESLAGQLSPSCMPGVVKGMLAALPDMKRNSLQQLQAKYC